ncbi:unnamed protein product, partial [Closterium sp. NIES-54]
MAPPQFPPRLCYHRHAALLLALLLPLLAPPRGANAATRVVIAPMRGGSKERLEVFKMSENLWFAGTAQLPPASEGSENRSERKLQEVAASAPAPAVDPMEQRLAEVGEFSARTTELKQVVKRKPAVGFPGLNEYSDVNSGTPPKYNNTVVRQSPPDVALCVGNGYILHSVNSAMVVYDKQGKQLTRIIPQNEFFGVLPRVVEKKDPLSASILGDRIGDMTCTYDRKANRFYLSTYWISGGANNTYDKFGQTRRRGSATVGGGLIVAASTTDDPTQDWNVFFIPGSNDGINSNPDWRAPLHFNTSRLTMFSDYPQIGTDAY